MRGERDVLLVSVERHVGQAALRRDVYSSHDELAAERCLQSLLYSTPKEEDAPLMPKVVSNNSLYPKARRFSKYVLPCNTLLTQLTGITESALYTFACFYRGSLLLAPDALSLSAYIEAVEVEMYWTEHRCMKRVSAVFHPYIIL